MSEHESCSSDIMRKRYPQMFTYKITKPVSFKDINLSAQLKLRI